MGEGAAAAVLDDALGDVVGVGPLVGDADHQTDLTVQKTHSRTPCREGAVTAGRVAGERGGCESSGDGGGSAGGGDAVQEQVGAALEGFGLVPLGEVGGREG